MNYQNSKKILRIVKINEVFHVLGMTATGRIFHCRFSDKAAAVAYAHSLEDSSISFQDLDSHLQELGK